LEDIKKALELSLQDAAPYVSKASAPAAPEPRSAGYVPKSLSKNAAKKPEPTPDPDDDPDLKAAIAASLADMEEQKAKIQKSHESSHSAPQSTLPRHRPDTELSPSEAENILLFSSLVERLHHQPPGTILREPQIQELYENVGKLRPKLTRTYAEIMSKHGMYLCATTMSIV